MVDTCTPSRHYGGIFLVYRHETQLKILLKMWTLPKLTLAFSSSGLFTLQNVLVDSHDPPALSPPQEVPRKPQDLDVEQLLIAPIGESSPKPYLCVSLFHLPSSQKRKLTEVLLNRFSYALVNSLSTKSSQLDNKWSR